MRLFTRWRNSAGERVRIALNLKKIAYDYVSVGSLSRDEYLAINPQGLMPALEVDGRVFAQSAAILAFLEEAFPRPALLPADPLLRAEARAFAAHIAAEMHAITVKRVRAYLIDDLGLGEDGAARWAAHWHGIALSALEAALARRATDWPFCFGGTPGWADLHLVPQLAASRRLGVDVAPYRRLLAVEANCVELDAFQRARPEAQPDFPAGEG
jgi:maleylacetoacetate isomerase